MPAHDVSGPSPPARPLSVLQVVRPALGGMREHVLELGRGLRDAGVRIEVACPAGSEVAREAASLGITVHEIDLVGSLRPWRDVRGMLQIASVLRRGRFDVIHAHGFKAGLLARPGAMLGGCRARIVTVHGYVTRLAGDTRTGSKPIHRAVERLLSRVTSRIIAVSEALRAELIEEYGVAPDLIVTIHNGLDLRPFLVACDASVARRRLDLPADALVVATAARFAPQKGLRFFVEAAAEVSSRRKGVVFVLGGDGPLAAELSDAVREAGLSPIVCMPGFITDLPAFLGAIDVYVSPSLSEGLGMMPVQAGAAGRPVVATNVGGTPEVVREGINGLLVPPGDAHALASRIEDLLDDPGLRERLGEGGRRIARDDFGLDRMIERTIAVYEEALRGPRAATEGQTEA